MDVSNTTEPLNLTLRLRELRLARGWSLEDLAKRCDVSRASLSRIEKGDVSPTTNVLGKLCSAYGLTLSRLMILAEEDYAPIVKRADQAVWIDERTGFRRRSVSPPSNALSCEVLECELSPGTYIEYPKPPSAGLEHHLLLLEGELVVEVDGKNHSIKPGDCLRYKLYGASSFQAHKVVGARYHLVVL